MRKRSRRTVKPPPRLVTGRNGSRLNEFTEEELLHALNGIEVAIEDCIHTVDTEIPNRRSLTLAFFLNRKALILAELERRRS